MTRTFTRHYEHHEIVWNGVTIAISYEPRWLILVTDREASRQCSLSDFYE